MVFSSDAITSGEAYTVYVGGTAGGTAVGGMTLGGSTSGATELGTVTAGQAPRRGPDGGHLEVPRPLMPSPGSAVAGPPVVQRSSTSRPTR